MRKRSDISLNLMLWLKDRLSRERRGIALAALRYLSEPLGFVFRRDLPKLAMVYGTDKWGSHLYAAHYARHFHHLRRKKLTLLEIGIGGYEEPQAGGRSLRMWRRYFPKAQIVGLDFFDKRPHGEERIRIYRGDQSDEVILRRIVAEVGRPDIVIDDGSHINRHVIKSFEVLFPLLAEDGIYVVEDTQTAYWPEYGGSSDDLSDAATSTSMYLLKSLVDGLNHEEFIKSGYIPSYLDQHITALHFYHNLVFIQKGRNDEGSQYRPRGSRPEPYAGKTA